MIMLVDVILTNFQVLGDLGPADKDLEIHLTILDPAAAEEEKEEVEVKRQEVVEGRREEVESFDAFLARQPQNPRSVVLSLIGAIISPGRG